jgi:hypothetical protein
MMATSFSAQKTCAASVTSHCNQIHLSCIGSNILWHWNHHKVITGILNRRRGNSHSRIMTALRISNSKRARAQHSSFCWCMSDQTNHFPVDKLDVPRAIVCSRAVCQQLRADGSELRTGAITPAQQKLLVPSIARTMALRTDAHQSEGDEGDSR